ncbi:hypothetical protein BC936DRAFT_141183 [Jimgerdemannia flammicorona]|uniref:DNA primase n=1 Tax=Jimgerdemannia flammicorona TaxID=994334 RepID=A0A433A2Q7_9FUNG|nr:hypothetical protein BC936DRAFT_141183 [Jimgerdemannia flammicorona]
MAVEPMSLASQSEVMDTDDPKEEVSDYGDDVMVDGDDIIINGDELDQIFPPAKLDPPPTFLNGSKMQLDENDPIMLLRVFYQRLFPYKTYFQWLNYDTAPTKNFTNREFSFTLASDVYIRYNSFQDADELRKEINKLQPVKIDIGAIYTARPKDKKTIRPQAFQPVEKELVFDIDMTDYDEVRTCCSGGNICEKCWEFMTISIRIIDAALREDFGFSHLLWVYSGRRGVHCWVCDERARKLTNDSRKSIVQYLEVIKGGAQQAKKVKLPTILHPSLKRSLGILKEHFEGLVLNNQRVLDEPENWNKVLQIVPDHAIRETLDSKWQKSSRTNTAMLKWEDLKNEIGDGKGEVLVREIMFQYCYPRLDEKVTMQINHLLKSPFCVHPKTNRVCVPIDPARCKDFDPFKVPTLAQLNKEINEYNGGEKRIADYEKTSLKPYMKIFDDFVNGLMKESLQNKKNESAVSMEF